MTIRDAKARADVEDNFRKTMGQLLGGAAVLLGAGFAYLQFQQQQENFLAQQENARKQLAASLEQSKQQRESAQAQLISNQVSKGFEQLGSKDLVVRLGGIYALEGVMNISEQYHQPILETLCAFVRDGTRIENAPAETPADKMAGSTVTRAQSAAISDIDAQIAQLHKLKQPATDIQAALTVIGRRAATQGRDSLDLGGAHLPRVMLLRANLRGAYLGSTDIRVGIMIEAKLSDAHLTRANLFSATLMSADLRRAYLNEANLATSRLDHADLSGADLTGAKLRLADLSGADLRGAKGVTQAQLDEACGKDVKLDPPQKIKPCPRPPQSP